MSTYREVVYMILDELKLTPDDSYFNENHVKFLLDKARAALLKKEYADNIKKQIADSNYQTLCLDVVPVKAYDGNICGNETYLKSTEKVPNVMNIGAFNVSTTDYYTSNISYVSKDRMKYVGGNNFTRNIVYCSLGPDNYIYLKSDNPQFTNLEKIQVSAVFEDPSAASALECSDTCDENNCKSMDELDGKFPLEEALIFVLCQTVVKDLGTAAWKPMDDTNDAKDALADLATYIAKNAKSKLAKELTDD